MGKNITSNISQGGSIAPIIPFLKSNFGDDWKEVKNRLEILCESFPKRFESLYSYDLDALGIDLGIDLKGNIGLFEVNTYPGQQFFYAEDAVVGMAKSARFDCGENGGRINAIAPGLTETEMTKSRKGNPQKWYYSIFRHI